MTKRRIEPLNDAELQWVAAELGNARRLVNLLSPNDAGAPLTPEVLDRAFKAARASAGATAETANATINAIGMAFGQYLVEHLGFKWVAVFENAGSEIAVVALPGQADVLVFPPNLVAKRWVNGTTNFLSYVYNGIEEDLRKFGADWAAPQGKNQSVQRTRAEGKFSWFRRWFGRGPNK